MDGTLHRGMGGPAHCPHLQPPGYLQSLAGRWYFLHHSNELRCVHEGMGREPGVAVDHTGRASSPGDAARNADPVPRNILFLPVSSAYERSHRAEEGCQRCSETKATFLVGMGTSEEGFQLELKEVPLTTAPKRYTIDVSRVRDRKVVGGFVDGFQWR